MRRLTGWMIESMCDRFKDILILNQTLNLCMILDIINI